MSLTNDRFAAKRRRSKAEPGATADAPVVVEATPTSGPAKSPPTIALRDELSAALQS
jgi:hypothetical protein